MVRVRWDRIRRLLKPVVVAAAVLAVLGVLVTLIGPLAWLATPAKHLQGKDKADAINATRQILLAAVGGLAVLTGAIFSARTYSLSKRGQFTTRYAKAIAHLASDKLTERVGGIYSLEHLMRESAVDHETVVEVLAAFIREKAGAQPEQAGGDDRENTVGENASRRLATDVQAALTVLGRRPQRHELNRIDLSYTDLRGARLAGARLNGAVLGGTLLQGAVLVRAQLQDALLDRAELKLADLSEANLQYASLDVAYLQDANLNKAKLQNASLFGATLQGAGLYGTEFCDPDGRRAASGLDAAQVAGARFDDSTRLPPALRAELTADEPPTPAEQT